MGVSLLNFFDLKPLNTSKRALNTNPPFFWDTLYMSLNRIESIMMVSDIPTPPTTKMLNHYSYWFRSECRCFLFSPLSISLFSYQRPLTLSLCCCYLPWYSQTTADSRRGTFFHLRRPGHWDRGPREAGLGAPGVQQTGHQVPPDTRGGQHSYTGIRQLHNFTLHDIWWSPLERTDSV